MSALAVRDLHALSVALRGESVLNVYVDGTSHDPSARRGWHVALELELKKVRSTLASASHTERADFEASASRLDEYLAQFDGAIGAAGLVCFASSDRVHHATTLDAAVPTVVAWRKGLLVGPYLLADDREESAVVLVVASKESHIFSYRAGTLLSRGSLHSHHAAGHSPAHLGNAPQAGFHTGTTGGTLKDRTQRVEEAASERLDRETTERAIELAGKGSEFLVAGSARERAAVAAQLALLAPHRVLELHTVDVHASHAQIVEAARAGIAELRGARDAAEVAQLVELAGSHGHGVLGPDGTHVGIEGGNVRTLYMTRAYVEGAWNDADALLQAAIVQGGDVRIVTGEAARLLAAHGAMGAALRYSTAPAPAC